MAKFTEEAHPKTEADGLPTNGRKLRNVSSFSESLDNFSRSASKLPQETLPIAIEIGAKLRAARLDRGLTQDALSTLSKVRQSEISEIEKGKGTNGPNCSTVEKIANVLGLKLDLVPLVEVAA